jgi:hypothetical protein
VKQATITQTDEVLDIIIMVRRAEKLQASRRLSRYRVHKPFVKVHAFPAYGESQRQKTHLLDFHKSSAFSITFVLAEKP